jgi:hypothetical protein
VLGFFSSRPNRESPTPSTAGEYVPSSFGSVGDTHSLAGEGVGGPNSDKGTDCYLMYFAGRGDSIFTCGVGKFNVRG